MATANDAESVHTLERPLDIGVTSLDRSHMHGPHTNEDLLGRLPSGR